MSALPLPKFGGQGRERTSAAGAGITDLRGLVLPFAGFALLAAWHWALMLDPAPLGDAFGVAAIQVATACLLVLLRESSGVLRRALALGALIAGFVASLLALGVPVAQLLPSGWEVLSANLADGAAPLSGDYELPLAFESEWTSTFIMAAVPLLLSLAAGIAFLMPRRSRGANLLALALLIAAVAIPTTARPSFAGQLLWGAVILVLVAAWLWPPAFTARGNLMTVGLVAAVALPLGGLLNQEDPWIDYRGWRIGEQAAVQTFDWNHSYGPIDWPRTGEPLFRVRSDQPRYWRAEVLDQFNGDRWVRSLGGGSATPAGEPDAQDVAEDQRWVESSSFSVLALTSPIVVAPGTPIGATGLDGEVRSADGVLEVPADGGALRADTNYSISSYAPDPSPEGLRRASVGYSSDLAPYTTLTIPQRAGSLANEFSGKAVELDQPVDLPDAEVAIPLYGSAPDDGLARSAERAIAMSPDHRIADLADRITAGTTNGYDAVKAIEEHLRSSYEYSEVPPERDNGLAAFLFRDRIGYCQHFSGAMAVMLRMSGIPARVATGFTPGVRVDGEDSPFEVTDLDAHSWVEVYFEDIGWVPFDPTPADSPAESQSGGPGVASAALGAGASLLAPDDGPTDKGQGDVSAAASPGGVGSGGGWGARLGLLLVLTVPVMVAAAITWLRALRHRGLDRESAAARELAELPGALAGSRRTTRVVPRTLLGIERELLRRRMPAAAEYVGSIRAARFSPGAATPPTLAARRAARRDLSAGTGTLGRLRMLLAMPPGGPRASQVSARARRDDGAERDG